MIGPFMRYHPRLAEEQVPPTTFPSLRALLLALTIACACALLSVPCGTAHAESGTVYSCTVVPCYRHPVTNVIEDAGGESGYATGLGMVESCIFTQGMLEVTDAGSYYLTIRIGLLDYSSGHAFQVQEWGASDWSSPALGVTGSGSDANGLTQDVCIQVPSQKCVVRMTMFVEPMGRDVICYCYPKDFVVGQPAGMNAVIVTEASGSSAAAGSNAAVDANTQATTSVPDAETAQNDSAPPTGAQDESSIGDDAAPGNVASNQELESVDDTAVSKVDETSADDLTSKNLSHAQGLTLSTASASAPAFTLGEDFHLDLPDQVATGLSAALGAGCVFIVGSLIMMTILRRNRLVATDPDDYTNLYGDDDD